MPRQTRLPIYILIWLFSSGTLSASPSAWEQLERAMESLPDNSFYEWQNSAMGKLVTCKTYPKVANCHRNKNVFDAWVTGSYVPERREFYILAPGGHNDAPESGSYRFDFNTRQWNLIDLDPTTPTIDLVEVGDYVRPKFNPDGQSACIKPGYIQREPVTYHSYDGQLYVPELNGILLFGHYTGVCGDPLLQQDPKTYQGNQGVFIFHLETQTYEQIFGLERDRYWFPTTGILTIDGRRVLYVTSSKLSGISFFKPELMRDREGRLRLVPLGHSGPRIFDGSSIVVDNQIISSSRNYHLTILTIGDKGPRVTETAKILYPDGRLKEDGYLSSQYWGPNGLGYYKPLNSLFQWRNDGYVLQIKLDSALEDDERFRLARPEGGDSQPGLQGGGIYGKWFWIEELGAFAGYDSNLLNWVFYKPPHNDLPKYRTLNGQERD